MLEKLTKEQENKTIEVRDFWLDKAFNKCHLGIDKPKFEKGLEWLYGEFLSLEKPKVVYCDSILEAVIKITLVKDFDKSIDIYHPNMLSLEGEIFTDEFKTKLNENMNLTSSYIGWSNFGWVSFYDFFSKIDVLNNEKFNNYKELIDSNVFECFEFEKVVFAVQPPKKIHYNERMQPSNTVGPAIIFNDGTEYYKVNGFDVTEELFDSLYNDTYTFEEFLKEKNEEIKSVVLAYKEERYGNSGVYDFMKDSLNEVDTYTDVKDGTLLEGTTRGQNIGTYTLFKGKLNNDIELAYVRCFCPSTDRMFFLGVEPHHTSAKDAIASLYRIPRKLKNEIKYIQRQGERFSTVFTDNGKNIMKSLSEDDVSDLVSISGDEYFNLMTYEY